MATVIVVALSAALAGRFALPPDEANPCGPTGVFVQSVHQGAFTVVACRFSTR